MKAVVLNSASYTGTTWLSLVLASHERGFALGNPDNLLERYQAGAADLCFVHGAACPVWQAIRQCMEQDGLSMFQAVVTATGRDVLVIANPRAPAIRAAIGQAAEDVWEFTLLRDARALAASFRRKHPDTDIVATVERFLYAGHRFSGRPPIHEPARPIRYEDLVEDPAAMLDEIANRIGVPLDRSALAYWRHEHHATGGNGHTLSTVQRAQGVRTPVQTEPCYDAFLCAARSGASMVMKDRRWESELSRFDRFVVDLFCGALNARRGYPRDDFDPGERAVFTTRLQNILVQRDSPLLRWAEWQDRTSGRAENVHE